MAERSASIDGVAAGGVSGGHAAHRVLQPARGMAAEDSSAARPAGDVQAGQRGAAGDVAGNGSAVAMVVGEARQTGSGGAAAERGPAHDGCAAGGVSGGHEAHGVLQPAGSVAAEDSSAAGSASDGQAGQRGAAGDAAGNGSPFAIA